MRKAPHNDRLPLYLAGVACLALAVPIALAPVWGPFLFGLLLLVIFLAWGLHLRKLGRIDT